MFFIGATVGVGLTAFVAWLVLSDLCEDLVSVRMDLRLAEDDLTTVTDQRDNTFMDNARLLDDGDDLRMERDDLLIEREGLGTELVRAEVDVARLQELLNDTEALQELKKPALKRTRKKAA